MRRNFGLQIVLHELCVAALDQQRFFDEAFADPVFRMLFPEIVDDHGFGVGEHLVDIVHTQGEEQLLADLFNGLNDVSDWIITIKNIAAEAEIFKFVGAPIEAKLRFLDIGCDLCPVGLHFGRPKWLPQQRGTAGKNLYVGVGDFVDQILYVCLVQCGFVVKFLCDAKCRTFSTVQRRRLALEYDPLIVSAQTLYLSLLNLLG